MTTEELAEAIHKLLTENNASMSADYMGDINLTVGYTVVGYWQGAADAEHFVNWDKEK